ncbi:MAG: type VI secretion lipoprotein TssJ [Desulfobacterales bacterium]|nr:type VI secretion lipoprotein TssJ [Desulfobacterales bacterium]MCP4158689.1 type VI secretion lipoprotein TssJ [Deltaproteobacteria bacterium]
MKNKVDISEKAPQTKVEATEETSLGIMDVWIFKKNAIEMHITPSKDLNKYQEREHTLFLLIFQMNDPNGFNSLCATTEGIQSILSGDVVESSIGILSTEKFVVSPGKEMIVKIDRAKSAQNIGFIAAYFNLAPEKVFKILKIPAVQDGKKGIDIINPFKDAPPARPAIMKIWMELDKSRIKDITLITE